MTIEIKVIREKINVMSSNISSILYEINSNLDRADCRYYIIPERLTEKNFIKLKRNDNTPNLTFIKDYITSRLIKDNIDFRNEFYFLASFIKSDDNINENDKEGYITEIHPSPLLNLSEDKSDGSYLIYRLKQYKDTDIRLEFEGEKEYKGDSSTVEPYIAYLKFINKNLEEINDYINAAIMISDIAMDNPKALKYNYENSRNVILNTLIHTNIKDLYMNEDLLQYTIENFYQIMCTGLSDTGIETMVYNLKQYTDLFIQAMEKNIRDIDYAVNKLGEFISHITKQFTNTENANAYFDK